MKKGNDGERRRPYFNSRTIGALIFLWAAVATFGWMFEHNRNNVRMKAEGEKFGKELTAAREYEFIVRFIDLQKSVDSDNIELVQRDNLFLINLPKKKFFSRFHFKPNQNARHYLASAV